MSPKSWRSSQAGITVLAAFVFISILGWTALALNAVMPHADPQALTAQAAKTAAKAPAGAASAECTADSETQIDPKTNKPRKVGQFCQPKTTIARSADGTPVANGELSKTDCVPADTIPAGQCFAKYCAPSDPRNCRFVGGNAYPVGTKIYVTDEIIEKWNTPPANTVTDRDLLECGKACGDLRGGDIIAGAYDPAVAPAAAPPTPAVAAPSVEQQRDDALGCVMGDADACNRTASAPSADDAAGIGPGPVGADGKPIPDCEATPGVACYADDATPKADIDKLKAAGWTCTEHAEYEGQICSPPGAAVPPPDPRRPSTFGDPKSKLAELFKGSNPMSALGSMLSGLGKALGGGGAGGGGAAPAAAPAQQCSVDPNVYAQQQQQYQQAQQQYNYQLQQYNYQRQLDQYYGGGAPTPPAPLQPSACTPSTSGQCASQPQQPPASACTAGAWRATYSGACVVGWQCVPTSTSAPTATLSCEPQVADVGMSLAITYSCSSGVASSNSFDVSSQPGGSATAVVKAPPAGTNTATYALACADNGKTVGAQCSVQVSRPNIILVANPKTVAKDGVSLLSWLTTGMKTCIISSPDQADFTARNSSNTSINGAATTSPIATSASFLLRCETLAGATRDATTTIRVAQ